MKERPILYNGDMVQAILDDRKGMTRRVIKLNHKAIHTRTIQTDEGIFSHFSYDGKYGGQVVKCPYGIPGDRLWVRETFFEFDPYIYRATANGIETQMIEHGAGWKPSIFMPKVAARIWLEVTDIRVDRVQDIGWHDCHEEGISYVVTPGQPNNFFDAFTELWDSINAKRGYGWEVNPWVWVITFSKL